MKHVSYHTRRILDLSAFLSHFEKVRESGHKDGLRQYRADCPAGHKTPQSLSIGQRRDGGYLVHCHAGCDASEVLSQLGLSLGDLYPDGCLADRIKPHIPGQLERTQMRPFRLHQVVDTYKRTGRVIDRAAWKQWAADILEVARATMEDGGQLSEADRELAKRVATTLRSMV